MASKKLNVTLQEDLIARADEFAKEHGMTRSGLISVALLQYMDAVEVMPDMKKLLSSMASIADGALRGETSPEVASAKMEAIQETYAALIDKR